MARWPAWLWGIAIRRLISRLRQRADFRLGPALLESDHQEISAEERVLLRLENVDVGSAMARISPELRVVLQLTVLDGLSTREAAVLLGIPRGTVKSRLQTRPGDDEGGAGMSRQSTPTWHLDEATLRAYVDGRPLTVVGASVEAHLVDCPDCRMRLGEVMPHEVVDRAWSAIRAHVEAPRRSLPERLIRRLGISTETARLLVAVPAFRGAWLLGLFLVTLFAGLAALFTGKYGLVLFLIVAPLAPVAGVAASFGGDADPCHELVTVTPHPAVRMLLLRTAGVLVTSLPITLLAGLALPGPAWLGVAWLTPASRGGRAHPAAHAPVRLHRDGHDSRRLLVRRRGHGRPSQRPRRGGRARHAADLHPPDPGRGHCPRPASTLLRSPGKAVMNTVTLNGLGKSYGRTAALCGVDLALAPGITGLLGPNGAGKTTMLRVLATALAADTGSVRILGEDPTTTEGRVAVRRRLGLCPAGDRVPPRLHGLRVRGLPGDPQAVDRSPDPAPGGAPGDRPGRADRRRPQTGAAPSLEASGAESCWPKRCSDIRTC